ncbi:MAG: hypothetical protein HYY84_01145 [Deltaproteobacteria bacterium]|nr:hypothetical protein [Deltaproteobacteria bacterium]
MTTAPQIVKESTLRLGADLPPWAIALVVIVAIAVLALNLRGSRRLSSRMRGALFALRFVAIVGAVVLVFQPTLARQSVARTPGVIAILVDSSESLAIDRRIEKARSFLGRAHGTLAALAPDVRTEYFTFSEELAPSTDERVRLVEPKGRRTRIRHALSKLREGHERAPLAAVILVSDGRDNADWKAVVDAKLDAESVDFLKSLGAPVTTVNVAESNDTPDLAIAAVRRDPLLFVHNEATVEVDVSATAIPKTTLRVTLTHDGRLAGERVLTLKAGASRETVKFTIAPSAVGVSLYTVDVSKLRGESVTTNNTHTFAVRVVRDKIRLLQVAGRPSWDERFFRQLMKQNPSIDLISFFILRTPTDLQLAPPNELSLIPFPTDELFTTALKSFDIVVFQNFDFRPYDMQRYLPRIRSFILEGGAFVMMGGDQSFGAGGYAGTPIEEVMPVAMQNGTAPSATYDVAEVKARLTLEGRRHPLMRVVVDPQQNAALWDALPGLEGLNFVTAKPGGIVVAEHGATRRPIVVAGEAKRGRVLAIATDSTWQWDFLASERAQARSAYVGFWSNALRWLTKDPTLKRIQVEVPEDTVNPGSAVRVNVRLFDESHAPMKRGAAHVDVTCGARKIMHDAVTKESGQAEIDLGALPEGACRVVATSTDVAGESAETAFVVASLGDEMAETRANAALLTALAAETGGLALRAGDSLPASFPRVPPRVTRIEREERIDLWDNIVVLLIIIGALAGEWTLRRRHALA